MLTPSEHAEWQANLDRRRKERADMGSVWPTPDDSGIGVPVEIAPGRGDLNRPMSGGPGIPAVPTALSMIGNSVRSFARLYESQPWIAASVLWMARRAVRVPLKCYFWNDDDINSAREVKRGEHPFADSLRSPWPNDRGPAGSQADLILAMLCPQLVHGNAVLALDSGANDKTVFRAQDWRFCRPTMPNRAELVGFSFNIDNSTIYKHYPISDVLHLKWWSPNNLIGTSPLQQLGITLRIEDAAQRYQQAVFQNGARPPSAIMMAAEYLGLDKPERDELAAQLRSDLAALYAGPENAGKPALLPPGLKWEAVGGTVVEAELIAQRKVTREEIAAVYGIPPPLEGILDRATYANIETQRDMTYTDILGPPLVLMESAINSQVIQGLLQDDRIFVAFDFGAVLRGDRLQEIEAIRQAVGSALFNPNEGRSILGMGKVDIPEMDKYYIPSNNMSPIDGPPEPAQPSGPPQPGGLPFNNQPDPALPPVERGQNGNGHHVDENVRRLIVERTYRQKAGH